MASARARFAAQGFDAVTIEDIAADAGVSRRTFFRYFPTKDAVAFAENASRLADFEAALAARPAAEGRWRWLRTSLMELAAGYEADRESLLVWHRVLLGSSLLIARDLEHDARWEAAIARFLGDDGTPTTRRARLRAAQVMGVVRATVREWFDSDATLPLVPLAADALDCIETGVSASEEEDA